MTMGGPPLPFRGQVPCGSCGFATSSPSYGSRGGISSCPPLPPEEVGTLSPQSRLAAGAPPQPKINNITLNMDSNAGPSEAPPLATLAKAPSQPPEALEGAASQLDIKRGGVLGASQFLSASPGSASKEAGDRPPSYSQYDAVRDRISPTPQRAVKKYDAVRDGVIQPVQPKQSLPQQVQEEERVSVYYDQVRDLTTKTPTAGVVCSVKHTASHPMPLLCNNLKGGGVSRASPGAAHTSYSEVNNKITAAAPLMESSSVRLRAPAGAHVVVLPSVPAPAPVRAPAGMGFAPATPVASPVRAPAAPAHLGTNRIPVEDPITFIVPALQGLKAAALSLDASPHEDQIAVSTDLVDKFYAQKSELALK